MKCRKAYAIIPVGENDRSAHVAQQKAPEVATPGLFYSVLGGWLNPKAGYQLFFSVQPFADVVGKGHIHTHFIVNSVNYENGHKLQWSKHDLKDFSRIQNSAPLSLHGLRQRDNTNLSYKRSLCSSPALFFLSP